jgi:hypothetical protein
VLYYIIYLLARITDVPYDIIEINIILCNLVKCINHHQHLSSYKSPFPCKMVIEKNKKSGSKKSVNAINLSWIVCRSVLSYRWWWLQGSVIWQKNAHTTKQVLTQETCLTNEETHPRKRSCFSLLINIGKEKSKPHEEKLQTFAWFIPTINTHREKLQFTGFNG